jgi:hypothetical protein
MNGLSIIASVAAAAYRMMSELRGLLAQQNGARERLRCMREDGLAVQSNKLMY